MVSGAGMDVAIGDGRKGIIMFGLCMTQTCKQEMAITQEMQWCGNIFPDIEEWLQKDCDHQKAVARYTPHHRRDKYQSVMDMIVGEFFGDQFRKKIFKYYKTKGGFQLHKCINDETRNKMEKLLFLGCIKIYGGYCQRRRVVDWGWDTVREVIHQELMAA